MRGPVLALGEILVEIMRPGVDQPLDRPGEFRGPYPSGAPAIFIDTVARLGWPAAFVAVVGADPFGELLLNRLRADGVDTSGIRQTTEAATAVAFVSYSSDGRRQFVFHIAGAAAGRLAPEHVDATTAQAAAWLHISGSTLLANESMYAACLRALELARHARVSLDPNLRAELLGDIARVRQLFAPIVRRAEIVLPSQGELELLTGEQSLDRAAAVMLAEGPRLVVLKRGAAGCSIYSSTARVDCPGFPSEEVDPTGAGDSFAAGFVVATLRGMGPTEAARYANAVGALAVRKQGPMEGAAWASEVESVLAEAAPPQGEKDAHSRCSF